MTECARHPGTEAFISCQRCSRPICPDCQIPAAVGFQCPDCVKSAGRSIRQPTTAFGGTAGRAGPPIVTTTLVAIGLLTLLASFVPATRRLLDVLVFAPGAGGAEPWRYVSYAVVGGGTFAPLIALVVLYLLGRECEALLGRSRFLACWLVSTLGGSVVFGLVSAPNATLFGIAGPTVGLAAAWFVLARRQGRSPSVHWMAWALLVLTVIFTPWPALVGCLGFGAAAAAVLAYAPRERRSLGQWGGLLGLLLLLGVVAVFS